MRTRKHKFSVGQYVVLTASWPGPRPGTLPQSVPWDTWPEGTVVRVTKTAISGTEAHPLLRYQVSDGHRALWIDEEKLQDSQQTLPLEYA